MRLLSVLLFAALLFNCLPVRADLIPPEVGEAQDRLRANPMAYDRVDEFCDGKKPGAGCTITGTTFSGGGEGVCTNFVNRHQAPIAIDMSCVRNGEVRIERKLPEGGFVNNSDLCKRSENECRLRKKVPGGPGCPSRWNCKPMVPTPADQFCKGKAIGSSCTVELTYQGNNELHAGICREIVETEGFYYQGHRTATRQVISCEPPPAAARTFTPASWHQKLLP